MPTRPVSSTCRADDAVRDPRGIFTDLAMPAVAAFAGPMCINTLLRTMYPGAASSILIACMMFSARFVPLQLLPSKYLLPDTSCALWIFACTQVGSRMLGLLWLWRIALRLRMWAGAARTLLQLERALSFERCLVPLHAMRRLCVLSRMLPGHMHMQRVPRVEGFAAVPAARTLEHPLRRSRRRRAPDVAQMLLQAFTCEETLAVRALRVPRRFPHLLSAAVSCNAKRQFPPLAPMLLRLAAMGSRLAMTQPGTARRCEAPPAVARATMHTPTTSDEGAERCRFLPGFLKWLAR